MFHLLLVVLGLFVAEPVFATADGPDTYRVTGVRSDDVLNLRAQPSAKSAILAKIPPNARELENMGERTGRSGEVLPDTDAPAPGTREPYWFKVRYQGVTGWVPIRYLRGD